MSNLPSLRLLFIGNSYTQRNDLPGMLATLAAAAPAVAAPDLGLPCAVATERVLANGASLRLHWNAGVAGRRISEEAWDAVVLQEQSTLPLKNPRRYHENVRLFADRVREAPAGADPARVPALVLYLTWARRDAPETQPAYTEAARAIAGEVGAQIAPVGVAWEAVRTSPGAPGLFAPDGSHPSPAGTYLAACVMYATVFRHTPVGLPVPTVCGLGSEHAELLQTAAWRTHQKFVDGIAG